MEKIIGIDLGTTNSAVSLLQEGKADVLSDANGEKLIPSVVGLDPNGQLLVGVEALRQYAARPDATVKSVKRHMGTEHKFHLEDQSFTATEISALILKKIKSIAEASVGEVLSKAVITVPAYFSDAQRQTTKQAGELAGLEVLRIINEPTAAALVYNLQSESPENVLVYDLGGGTFDVSIVEISGDITEVLASHGNNMLGGDDFDRKLQNWLVQEFEKQHKVDLRSDSVAMARLNRAAEKAKVQLSEYVFVKVNEEFLAKKGNTPLHLSTTVNREDFDEMIHPLLESTLNSIDQALSDAQLTPDDIDRVVLAGGSTRIPLVRKLLEGHLGKSVYDEINPDLCVALGAGYQGGIISGESLDSILVDVTPYSLGVGASIDTPFGHFPDHFSVIIPRNTVVPVSRSEVYTNPEDNMDRILVEVFQGEQSVASNNISLGEMWIEDLPKASAGSLKIEVHFDFDVNGILQVTAHDQESGKKASVSFSSQNSQLNETQMVQVQDRLDQIWESHEDDHEDAESDVIEGEFVSSEPISEEQQTLLQRAESQVDQVEDDGEKEDLQQLIADLKASLSSGNADEIERLTEELSDVLYYLEQ